MMKNTVLRQLLFFIAPFVVASASYAVENQQSLWYGTSAKKQISEDYTFHISAQIRYGLDIGDTKQVLYSTGVSQNLSDSQGLGYFYGLMQTNNTKEHRLTLQHAYKYGAFTGFNLSHRVRLEARFLEDISSDGGRFRAQFKADQADFNNLGLVVWDEIFLNTNKTQWNGNDTMDRNRIFIGFKKPLLDGAKLEFGYMNQYVPRAAGDISEHIAVLSLGF